MGSHHFLEIFSNIPSSSEASQRDSHRGSTPANGEALYWSGAVEMGSPHRIGSENGLLSDHSAEGPFVLEAVQQPVPSVAPYHFNMSERQLLEMEPEVVPVDGSSDLIVDGGVVDMDAA